jgi:DNA-binding transcriptional MerR regulator
MAHKIAKLLLKQAGTFLDRSQAIAAAIALGMPLNEIEEYLDWLDATRPPPEDPSPPPTDNDTDAE